MPGDLNFVVEEKRTAIDVFTLWAPRIALAAAFVLIGYSKFDNDPKGMWVQLFEKIGFGQWFRYLAGAMQIAGALLLFSRRTITLGAAMLGATMIGAAITDVVVMKMPVFAIFPLILLGLVFVVWFSGRHGAGAS